MAKDSDSRSSPPADVDLSRVRSIMARVRQISMDDVQFATASMGRAKVAVARLIKEQRDLQEAIHQNTARIKHHIAEAETQDQQVAMEHLRAKEKYEETHAHLTGQLSSYRGMAEIVVDRIRCAELLLNDFRRFKTLVEAYDVSIELELSMEQLKTVGGTLSIRENAINLQDFEDTLATLEGKVRHLRMELESKERLNTHE